MRSINVLVVDDEKDMFLSTKLVMQLLEYDNIKVNVSYSASAKEAIEMIENDEYEIILLDIIMESIDAGYQVIDYVNTKPVNKPKIYVRSGQPGNIPDQYMSLLESVDGYLNKTDCTMEKLHEIIRSVR